MNVHKLAVLFLLVALVLFLATGCNVPTTDDKDQEPTIDQNALRTEIAQTVIAGITLEAVLNPSTTPTTAETPTKTQPPAVTATSETADIATETATLTPTTKSSGGGGGSWVPTSTSDYTDQAICVSTSPEDFTVMTPNQDFDAVWTIKNTGKRAWNADFYYKYKPEGSDIPKRGSDWQYISGIAVGDTINVVVDMTAPGEPGTYRSYWALVNDDAVEFFHFYIVITVAG